ncbi:MAG: HAMP domain-containing protein, partial [Planctomycetes bacterium]|nr:HAMP domain-containing protein [Planctomycetota bacterium]
MSLRKKFIIGCALVGVFIPLFVLSSLQKSQKVLRQTIARDLTLITRETMNQIERAVWIRLGQIELQANALAENPALLNSNLQFASMDDYRLYLVACDKQWQVQDVNDPNSMINQMLDHALCERLTTRIKQTFFYAQRFGYDIFEQVTVTNRFGAVIGQTSPNKQYDLRQQPWWKHAREQGSYVGPIDLRTGTMDMAVPILDVANNFMGVIQCSLNAQEYNDILGHLAKNSAYTTAGFTLLSQNKTVLHATGSRHWTCVSVATNARGSAWSPDQESLWFLVKNPSDRSKPKAMITRAFSRGHRDYEGQKWSLYMSVDASEALYPVAALKMAMLTPFLMLCLATVAAAVMFTYSVLRPIEKLAQTADAIRHGNLKAKANIKSHDEIGHLAESFDQMTGELEHNINSLNKQIEERHRAEEGMAKLTGNLVESVQELETANQEIRQITYAAAHDLKTPLRGMSMISQWLLEDHGYILAPEAQEQIAQLSYRAERFDKLLDGLREYSTLPAEEDAVQDINLTEYLNALVHRYYKAHEPHVTIPENLPDVKSPATAIKTVFCKLFDNAI